MAKRIVKDNADRGSLTKAQVTKGNKALDEINNLGKKTKELYLDFGQLWLQVRQDCTPEGKTSPDTKRMGAIRTEQFGDKIDAQTASYAARMAEYWLTGCEGFMPLKDWQEKNSPKASNPRPLVQAYVKWIKAEKAKAKGEGKDEDNDNKDNKTPDAGKLILLAKQALTALGNGFDNSIYTKDQLGEINSMVKVFSKKLNDYLADGKMAPVEDKKTA